LATARDTGFKVFGTEFSVDARILCSKRDLVVSESVDILVESGFVKKGSVDVVTAFEVIEHLAQPSMLLKQAKQVLKPQGFLCLTTPNFNALSRGVQRQRSVIFGYPDHLCFFFREWFILNAASYGFEVLDIRTEGVDTSLFNNLWLGPSILPPIKAEYCPSQVSVSERLRDASTRHRSLKHLKNLSNIVLNFLDLGETLKVLLRSV
jgi:SAM-dependent methyltransferase